MRAILVLLCVPIVFLTGCPGSGVARSSSQGGGNPQPISLSVMPQAPSIALNGSQQFSATVANTTNQAVQWNVVEGTAGGTISPSGLYKAPLNSSGVFHVMATSKADAAATAVIPITVHLGLTISPAGATLTLNQQQTFAATVVGSNNTSVNWSVQEGAGGGTISPGGVYQAPPEATGTFHVVAQSQADTTVTSVVDVIVQAGSVNVGVH